MNHLIRRERRFRKTYSTFPRGIESGQYTGLKDRNGKESKTYSTFPRGIERYHFFERLIVVRFCVRPIRHSHGELKVEFLNPLINFFPSSVRPIRHSHGELKVMFRVKFTIWEYISKTYSTFPRGIERSTARELIVYGGAAGKTYSTFPRGIEREIELQAYASQPSM